MTDGVAYAPMSREAAIHLIDEHAVGRPACNVAEGAVTSDPDKVTCGNCRRIRSKRDDE